MESTWMSQGEGEKQVRGEKIIPPTGRQQTSGKPEASVSLFSSGECLHCQTLLPFPHSHSSLSKGGFTVPISMLPHSSHSQGEPSATQPLEKNPPGAPKLPHKDLCACASFNSEKGGRRGILLKVSQQAEPEIQDYWNYSCVLSLEVLF